MKSDFIINSAQFFPRNASKGTEIARGVLRKDDEDTETIFVREAYLPQEQEFRLGEWLVNDRVSNLPHQGDPTKMRAARPAKCVLEGEDIEVQSRDPGRTIRCRVIQPKAERGTSGVFLHFHGGGLAVGGQDEVDPLLHRFANASRCVIVSVGYRLAPENPYPSSARDCFDVADYIFENGVENFGGQLQFIGGESAGGYLAIQTFFHLSGIHEQWNSLKGLVLTYSVFSLSYLPSTYTTPNPVCIDSKKMDWYYTASFQPQDGQTERMCREFDKEFGVLAQLDSPYDAASKHPAISPLFRSLEKLRSRLPTAFFLCGTADPLLDDTVLMSARWQIAGGRAVVKFVTGAPHAFVELPIELADCCVLGNELIREFLEEASL